MDPEFTTTPFEWLVWKLHGFINLYHSIVMNHIFQGNEPNKDMHFEVVGDELIHLGMNPANQQTEEHNMQSKNTIFLTISTEEYQF